MIEYLIYLVYLLSGIGGITCIVFHRRLPPAFLILGVYLLFAMASQFIASIIARYTGNNISFYNSVILINFVLTYAVFRKMNFDAFYRKRLTAAFGIGVLGVLIFIVQSFSSSFASRSLTISNLAVTIFSLLYFYQMLRIPSDQSILKQGKFWVAAGFLIHHLAGFSYWLLYEYALNAFDLNWRRLITIFLADILYTILIAGIFIQLKFGRRDRA